MYQEQPFLQNKMNKLNNSHNSNKEYKSIKNQVKYLIDTLNIVHSKVIKSVLQERT